MGGEAGGRAGGGAVEADRVPAEPQEGEDGEEVGGEGEEDRAAHESQRARPEDRP